MSKTFIIAELGINHNGNIDTAKKLIKAAKLAGADLIKLQKRTIDLVYTKAELDKYRESPWGKSNRVQKEGLEFNKIEYDIVNAYCKMLEIDWFASAWDLESQEFLKQYDLKYNKVASPMLTHYKLIDMIAKEKKYTFISTGMSTMDEIARAVEIFRVNSCPFELMHCNSAYPSEPEELNLLCIPMLSAKFSCQVGYSGHEVGLTPSVVAASLGASSIERHITLNRSLYGSDQASSIEPGGFKRLVDYIRETELSLGKSEKIVTEKEESIKKKLRRSSDISL